MLKEKEQEEEKYEKDNIIKNKKVWNYYYGLFSDLIDGFFFWSFVIHIFETVFFYALFEMAFTGWEVSLFSFLSPMFLFISSFRRFIVKNVFIFRLLSLFGLFGFYAPAVHYKLGFLGVGKKKKFFKYFYDNDIIK